MPKFSEWLFGKKGKVKKAETLTPEQQNLLNLISEGLTKGSGPFSEMFGEFNPEDFQKGVADPMMKNFQENILPQLQEKFIAGNQVMGSGMRHGQLKAATDLQSNLAALLYEAQQRHAANRAQGMQTVLGTRAFENMYRPATQGTAQAFAEGAGQAFGATAAGGPTAGIKAAPSAGSITTMGNAPLRPVQAG